MRAIYLWCMRNGSQLLFALSVVLFVIGFGQALLSLRNTVGQSLVAGEAVSEGVMEWLLFLNATLSAFGYAILPFIGAVAIHRWDEFRRS